MKTYLFNLSTRLRIAWWMLTGRHPHFMFIRLSREELLKQLRGDDFEVNATFHGLQIYNCKAILKQVGDSIDNDALILEKAHFEAKAEGLI